MTSADAQSQIQCPIDLFEPQEAKIEALTKAINAAGAASGKAPNARMLIDELNVLLDCASYDRANRNCRLCRNFSELRRKTANLIVKIGAMGAAN
jgi:hypothetical protein